MTYAKDGKVQLSVGNWISLIGLVATACASVFYSAQVHMVEAEKRIAVIESNSEHMQEDILGIKADIKSDVTDIKTDIRALRNLVISERAGSSRN